MSRLNVGDKVRVVKSTDCTGKYWVTRDAAAGVKIGDEGVIVSIAHEVAFRVDFDKVKGHIMGDSQLQLISTYTTPASFQVGDRVVHEVYGAGVVTAVDTVETTLPYRVDFSDTFYQWVSAAEITRENTTKTTDTSAPAAEVVAPTSPAIERKFKVGDSVRLVDGDDCMLTSDKTYTVTSVSEKYLGVNGGKPEWWTARFELVNSSSAIVALIENGTPKPSSKPYVHATTEAATSEAERLARKYAGQKFGVYELVSTRFAQVDVTMIAG